MKLLLLPVLDACQSPSRFQAAQIGPLADERQPKEKPRRSGARLGWVTDGEGHHLPRRDLNLPAYLSFQYPNAAN